MATEQLLGWGGWGSGASDDRVEVDAHDDKDTMGNWQWGVARSRTWAAWGKVRAIIYCIRKKEANLN